MLSVLNSIKKLKQLFINKIMPYLSLIVTTQKCISLIFFQSSYTMHNKIIVIISLLYKLIFYVLGFLKQGIPALTNVSVILCF